MKPATDEFCDAHATSSTMLPADTTLPPDSLGEGFALRQFRAAGLESLVACIQANRSLEFDDAMTLSRCSLPILAKLIQLLAKDPPLDLLGESSGKESLPVERVDALPDCPQQIGQPLGEWEPFCRELIALRARAATGERIIAWLPILPEPLDRETMALGESMTGVDVLRAIALARLVLPATIEIRAPLSVLGPKLAHVALSFGASHLGYVAAEGQIPRDAAIADPAVLDELLNDCKPTLLKDQPQPAPVAL